jgi:hypothetical protein
VTGGAFARFERALAAGLSRGQVLRCAGAEARAVDWENPAAGQFRVVLDDGDALETPDPHLAARLWHMRLYEQVRAGNY